MTTNPTTTSTEQTLAPETGPDVEKSVSTTDTPDDVRETYPTHDETAPVVVDSPEGDTGTEQPEGDTEGEGDTEVYAKLAAEEKKYRQRIADATATIERLNEQLDAHRKTAIEHLAATMHEHTGPHGRTANGYALANPEHIWALITPDECLDDHGNLDPIKAGDRIEYAATQLDLERTGQPRNLGSGGEVHTIDRGYQTHPFEKVTSSKPR